MFVSLPPKIDADAIIKAARVMDDASSKILAYAKEIGLPIRSAYVGCYSNFAEVRLDGHHRLFKNIDGKRSLTSKTIIIKGSEPWSAMNEAAEAYKAKRA